MKIRFSQPRISGNEIEYIKDVLSIKRFCGNGKYTQSCQLYLEKLLKCPKVLLTHSCTAALEMAALVTGIKQGDEVIMPSFTFASTANAFVLRGATPVFVDVHPKTLNIQPDEIASAINERTKAIVPVHYAGVPCKMNEICKIADHAKLYIIEDAAQSLMSTLNCKHAGTFGDLGAISFHETKNIQSGEGGALIINNANLIERSEIAWEKGTNRAKFFRGEVDKYTWVDLGSSFLPADIIAAFIYAQLKNAENITQDRLRIWGKYMLELKPLADCDLIELPYIPENVLHNGHIFYILVKNYQIQRKFISFLEHKGIAAVHHYVPLHSSPAGKKYGRTNSKLKVTESISNRLIRLPIWPDMSDQICQEVVNTITKFFEKKDNHKNISNL